MGKSYLKYFAVVSGELLIMLLAFSCRKDARKSDPVNFAKIGLYEQFTGGINRRLIIAVLGIGNQATAYGCIFDTGSTGMTIDANGILPASMISSSGFQIAGDSVNVNGITVTTQEAIVTYGDVGNQVREYGNLAYAPVTIGEASSGVVTTPRIPIFLYYKVVNLATGQKLAAHSVDVFGVGPGVSYTSKLIASPLSYFNLAPDVTSGFRLAALKGGNFTSAPTFVPDLLFIGLTPKDLNTSGFTMHPLTSVSVTGYSSSINTSINYNGQTIQSPVLFDTGTPATSIIMNSKTFSNVTVLPANTSITLTTSGGFNYQYTTTSNYNLTMVESTSYSHDTRSVFSIDFFLENQFLIDYTNHNIGLKNN
jgi:hypothetical protein